MQATNSVTSPATDTEHVFYSIADWRDDVAAGATLKGYQAWVDYQIETHGGTAAHCADCGNPVDVSAAAHDTIGRICTDCEEKHIEENLYKLLEITIGNFDFGDETVECTGGWEYDGDKSWTCAVFLANRENPEEASIKKLFTVTLTVNFDGEKASIDVDTYFR